MQTRRFVAVCLSVAFSSACGVPAEPLEATEDVTSNDAAAEPSSIPPLGKVHHPLAQRAYVKASNTDPNDYFGVTIALSADGSTLAVAAWGEDSAAAGVGANEADDSAEEAGAVYVFRRHGKQWIQQAYLKASNPATYDFFGYSLAISADGSTLAVGATGEDSGSGIDGDQSDNSVSYAGAVYVFARHGMTWTQEAYVKAGSPDPFDSFGYSVALSADGSTLAVGARFEDSAATGLGGDPSDNSALDAGAAYVFTRSGTTWQQQAYVKASNAEAQDYFGVAVALSGDGSTLAVSTPYEDSAATGVGGDQSDNSAEYTGAVYVFTRSAATWTQQAYVKASNPDPHDNFGHTIALSGDGRTLAVAAIYEDSAATGTNGDQSDNSADGAGAVYVFTRSAATWSQQAYVKASNTAAADLFGVSLALSADGAHLVVGAIGEDSVAPGASCPSAPYAGAAYVLARSGATWSQDALLKASNGEGFDAFGGSVASSADGSIVAVGAIGEDSTATGVGGDQANDSAAFAGATYVFDRHH